MERQVVGSKGIVIVVLQRGVIDFLSDGFVDFFKVIFLMCFIKFFVLFNFLLLLIVEEDLFLNLLMFGLVELVVFFV